MNGRDDELESVRRRSLLQYTALAGRLGVLPTGTAVGRRSGQSSVGTNEVVLGDFEDGLDGWTTTGTNELDRVTDDELPMGVVSGRHALVVEVDGDAHPMIENRRRVEAADFEARDTLGEVVRWRERPSI